MKRANLQLISSHGSHMRLKGSRRDVLDYGYCSESGGLCAGTILNRITDGVNVR
jgi:hypothetical protein